MALNTIHLNINPSFILLLYQKIAENKDKDTKVKGALHGIPISVKECYYVKGYDCTAGIAYFLEQPVEEDNVLLQVFQLHMYIEPSLCYNG